MIALYLVAIVLANVTVAMFGPQMTIVNAFLFIGLDLTSRDKLHDAWHGTGLWWKMATLIAVGSVLSYLVNRDTAMIAVASFVAFALSGMADVIVYSLLRRRSWFVRVNGSNFVSAAVDSVVFPTLAFGALMPVIIVGQFSAKVVGGAVWAWVLGRNHD